MSVHVLGTAAAHDDEHPLIVAARAAIARGFRCGVILFETDKYSIDCIAEPDCEAVRLGILIAACDAYLTPTDDE